MNADSKLNAVPAAYSNAGFSFRRAFRRHWRSSVRYYGLRHTLWQLAEATYRFFREFLPDRRKAKYGDLDYDFDHSVDTTRANVGFRAQLIAALTGHQYFPSEPWLFQEMMNALPIRFQDFTFIDLGSGKGRVLLMAATFGFKRIIGVEYMPEWHRAAEENVRKYAESRIETYPDVLCGTGTPLPIRAQKRRANGALSVPDENFENDGTDKSVSTPAGKSVPAGDPGVCATRAASIETLCMDARDFEFPDGPVVLYLFNPFPEPVFAAVLDRLRESLLKNPRRAFVAYRYPEYESLLQKCDWLEKIAGTEQWAVWKHRVIR